MSELPTKKISILIVISNLEYGGAQRQVVELANYIDRDRFDLHICSLSDYVPLKSLLTSSNVHVIQKRHKFDISVVPRLAKLLKDFQIDLVHGYLFDAEIAVRLAGKLAGTAVIGNSERNTNYTMKKRQLLAYRITRNLVDFCIANSQSGAAFNQQVLGNPPDSYYTIHNGVDTKRFRLRDRGVTRAKLNLDDRHFIIGMFGSFKEQKNHPLLFKAVHIALKSNSNLRILLVGDQLAGGMHGSDEYKMNTINLAKNLGLESHLIYVGNHDNVEELYPACDITALPSLFEGTPNVALESMACGIPIIATDVSDNAYIVQHGKTGFVIPLNAPEIFAEHLLALANNDDSRIEFGTNARKWMVEEFSCEKLARKTEAVYMDLVTGTATDSLKYRSFKQ